MANLVSWRWRERERGQWSLIGLMLSLLILVVIAWLFLWPAMRTHEGGTTMSTPQQAIERAKDVDCANNLRQIRYAIVMYRNENERAPATLQELRMGVGPDFFRCPIGKEPYAYDPTTGAVRCTHPGHGRF